MPPFIDYAPFHISLPTNVSWDHLPNELITFEFLSFNICFWESPKTGMQKERKVNVSISANINK